MKSATISRYVCVFLRFLFSLLLKPVALPLFHLHSHAVGRKTINFRLASLYRGVQYNTIA